jgi:ribulose-5-phosphate 4-epimerase/fuculose-1-phosphate aldolase
MLTKPCAIVDSGHLQQRRRGIVGATRRLPVAHVLGAKKSKAASRRGTLANHGIVCWGDTVTHAEWYVEVSDTYCWTLMLAAGATAAKCAPP